jgi:hypothetical protein
LLERPDVRRALARRFPQELRQIDKVMLDSALMGSDAPRSAAGLAGHPS